MLPSSVSSRRSRPLTQAWPLWGGLMCGATLGLFAGSGVWAQPVDTPARGQAGQANVALPSEDADWLRVRRQVRVLALSDPARALESLPSFEAMRPAPRPWIVAEVAVERARLLALALDQPARGWEALVEAERALTGRAAPLALLANEKAALLLDRDRVDEAIELLEPLALGAPSAPWAQTQARALFLEALLRAGRASQAWALAWGWLLETPGALEDFNGSLPLPGNPGDVPPARWARWRGEAVVAERYLTRAADASPGLPYFGRYHARWSAAGHPPGIGSELWDALLTATRQSDGAPEAARLAALRFRVCAFDRAAIERAGLALARELDGGQLPRAWTPATPTSPTTPAATTEASEGARWLAFLRLDSDRNPLVELEPFDLIGAGIAAEVEAQLRDLERGAAPGYREGAADPAGSGAFSGLARQRQRVSLLLVAGRIDEATALARAIWQRAPDSLGARQLVARVLKARHGELRPSNAFAAFVTGQSSYNPLDDA